MALLAVAAGILTTAIRIVRLRRTSQQSEVVLERRHLEGAAPPLWWKANLDLIAIGIGVFILGINVVAGGLRSTPVEGTAVALAFYVLLAPIALWLGAVLLAIRGVMALLARWSRPDRSAPLPSWTGAWLRWLGRRPSRPMVSLVLGSLAVAFGAYVLTFAATYETAKQSDAQAAIGADLRLTPGDPRFTLPPLGPTITEVSPFRIVSARVGSDRKSILAIDLPSYAATVSTSPRMLAGQGLAGLVNDPMGVLINSEIAEDFSVGPGDPLPLTIFPDEFENSKDLLLHVAGVFSSFPPTSPPAELVAAESTLPRANLVPTDFYLARVGPGESPPAVANALSSGVLADKFGVVTTVPDPMPRGLTSLSLAGLNRIETLAAGLIAALGVAVLGAFLVLERQREFAVLRSMGAESAQILTGPALESGIVVLGSLAIGLPVGLGLGALSIRVLGLFFALPPPLLTIPFGDLVGLGLVMVLTSTAAIGAALVAVDRVRVASVLKEL